MRENQFDWSTARRIPYTGNKISSQMFFRIDELSKETGIDMGLLCQIYEQSHEHYNKIDKLSAYFRDQKEGKKEHGLTPEKANLYSNEQIEQLRVSAYKNAYDENFRLPEPNSLWFTLNKNFIQNNKYEKKEVRQKRFNVICANIDNRENKEKTGWFQFPEETRFLSALELKKNILSSMGINVHDLEDSAIFSVPIYYVKRTFNKEEIFSVGDQDSLLISSIPVMISMVVDEDGRSKEAGRRYFGEAFYIAPEDFKILEERNPVSTLQNSMGVSGNQNSFRSNSLNENFHSPKSPIFHLPITIIKDPIETIEFSVNTQKDRWIDLKKKIFQKTEIPVKAQKIIISGCEVNDNEKITEYKIRNAENITLLQRSLIDENYLTEPVRHINANYDPNSYSSINTQGSTNFFNSLNSSINPNSNDKGESNWWNFLRNNPNPTPEAVIDNFLKLEHDWEKNNFIGSYPGTVEGVTEKTLRGIMQAKFNNSVASNNPNSFKFSSSTITSNQKPEDIFDPLIKEMINNAKSAIQLYSIQYDAASLVQELLGYYRTNKNLNDISDNPFNYGIPHQLKNFISTLLPTLENLDKQGLFTKHLDYFRSIRTELVKENSRFMTDNFNFNNKF